MVDRSVRWNLAAVAGGMRPGWLWSPSGAGPPAAAEADAVRRAARGMGLHVSPDLVAEREGEALGFLVTRARVRVPAHGRVGHGWVGRRLGLPCSSDAPWDAPEGQRAYAVLGYNPVGEPPRARRRKHGGWIVRCEGVFTTFWCGDAGEAQAWWRALGERPATRRFVRDVLAPEGREMFFHLVLEAALGPRNYVMQQ